MILIIGTLFSCENSIKTVQQMAAEDTTAAMTATNINYVRSDSGRIQLKLKSPLMIKLNNKDHSTEFPNGFTVDFYDTTGNVISVLSANYGIREEAKGLLQAQKNVVLKNLENHQTLYTENLIWNDKSRKIQAPGPVKIIGPSRIIYGDSMVSNESFTNRTIFGIRGTLEVKEEGEK
ncbi:MAG: LPS export ABC transporter periplasmic protein LptC [Bacteroidales bacterium]|nr:LPS export ABC transporter periplasmic protein LptC [Bacteroidales bacterium]